MIASASGQPNRWVSEQLGHKPFGAKDEQQSGFGARCNGPEKPDCVFLAMEVVFELPLRRSPYPKLILGWLHY